MGGWTVAIAAILLIPLLTKAPWTVGDFVFAGVGLFGCATAYELATRNTNSKARRIAVAAAILVFIFLVIGWAATGPDGR